MLLRILKKDLRRQVTMNAILLLFVMLAAMFAAGSVSNILHCLGGVGDFFALAGMRDFVALHRGDDDARAQISGILEQNGVSEYETEEAVLLSGSLLFCGGRSAEDIADISFLMPCDALRLRVFDSSDQPLTDVQPGTVCLPAWFLERLHAAPGDALDFRLPGGTVTLTVADSIKDALFGSPMIGTARVLVSRQDYDALLSGGDFDQLHGRILYASADDPAQIEAALNETTGVLFAKPAVFLRRLYLVDVFVAAVMLAVSVCLICIAVVVLKFTVSFTLNEELREIGVMKAIGIPDRSIRGLYLAKYAALAAAGSLLGFAAGIPFGQFMQRSISEKMVLDPRGGLWVQAAAAGAVVLTVLWFSWRSTAGVVHATPMDAFRADSGEGAAVRRGLRMARTRLPAVLVTALNDVLNAPKRYLPFALTLMLCLSIVQVLHITADTFEGTALLPLFQLAECDAYVTLEPAEAMRVMHSGGEQELRQTLDTMQAELAAAGIPAEVFMEMQFVLTCSYGENQLREHAQMGFGVLPDAYPYLYGDAPQNAREIALSVMMADRLGAGIGDTVQLHTVGGTADCLVTGVFETVNNLGLMVRIHPDMAPDFSQLSTLMAVQLRYTDAPTPTETAVRTETLRQMFGERRVCTPAQYCAQTIGVGNRMRALKTWVFGLALLITALVTVLMERSFVVKDAGEIALLKALGFRGRAVCRMHMVRFAAAGIAAAAVTALLGLPLARLCLTPVLRSIGARSVRLVLRPLADLVLCPLALIAASALAAFVTAHTGAYGELKIEN